MSVGLVWAQAANGVIGRDGTLPWHLPEDMAHFRALTAGSTVVMGRRTWESLPARFRPLPGRRNVVLTHDLGWTCEGGEVAHDMAEALRHDGDVWVLGGATVFSAAMSYATHAVVTELRESFAGDVCAPSLGPQWQLHASNPVKGWLESVTGLHYRVRRYHSRAKTGYLG